MSCTSSMHWQWTVTERCWCERTDVSQECVYQYRCSLLGDKNQRKWKALTQKKRKKKNLVCNITVLIVLEFPFLDEFLTCENLWKANYDFQYFFPPATHLVSHSTFFKQSHSVKMCCAAPCSHKNSLKKQAWDLGLRTASVFSNCLLLALTAKYAQQVACLHSNSMQVGLKALEGGRDKWTLLFTKADYKIWRPKYNKIPRIKINTKISTFSSIHCIRLLY